MSNTPGPSRFTFDEVTGALLVSSTGGGGTSAVNITQVLGNPISLSNPLPVELSDGTNPFGTPGNPLSVNIISGAASNASIGVVGSTAPASATEIGLVDSLGKLRAPVVDPNANLLVAFSGPLLTVLQEILVETRITRKLLMMVYEESGEGVPTDFLDDPLDPNQTDYN